MNSQAVSALSSFLGCTADMVAELKPGVFLVNGRTFFLVGPTTLPGLPAMSNLVQIGSKNGYAIYTTQ